jgi:aspartyl aminopeptidase
MTKKKWDTNKRISRAIIGMQIPITIIPELAAHLEAKMAEGASDEELAAAAKQFVEAAA